MKPLQHSISVDAAAMARATASERRVVFGIMMLQRAIMDVERQLFEW